MPLFKFVFIFALILTFQSKNRSFKLNKHVSEDSFWGFLQKELMFITSEFMFSQTHWPQEP